MHKHNPLDVVKAIQSSKKNFGEFSALNPEERLGSITRIFNHLKLNHKEILEVESRITLTSQADLLAQEYTPFFVGFEGRLKLFLTELSNRSAAEPVGVVGWVLPRTQGVFAFLSQVARELLIGNTVVVKPSNQVGELWQALENALSQVAVEPAAKALSFLCGDREVIGSFLVRHPGLDALHFGGSVAAARAAVTSDSVLRLPVRVESSSINSALVLKECDVALAARLVATNLRHRLAQSNRSIAKIYVVDSVLEEFKGLLITELSRLNWPNEIGAGALANRFTRTVAQIEDEDGKNLLSGDLARVALVAEDFNDCSELQQEEWLMPILLLRSLKYPADVFKWINAQPFGRSVTVFCNDLDRVKKLSAKFDCGRVYANALESPWDFYPWQAMRKGSGWGHLGEFSSPKQIV